MKFMQIYFQWNIIRVGRRKKVFFYFHFLFFKLAILALPQHIHIPSYKQTNKHILITQIIKNERKKKLWIIKEIFFHLLHHWFIGKIQYTSVGDTFSHSCEKDSFSAFRKILMEEEKWMNEGRKAVSAREKENKSHFRHLPLLPSWLPITLNVKLFLFFSFPSILALSLISLKFLHRLWCEGSSTRHTKTFSLTYKSSHSPSLFLSDSTACESLCLHLIGITTFLLCVRRGVWVCFRAGVK